MAAFDGKIVLVTGASSGLGAETAKLFSNQGATVFGIGRDSDRLAQVFHDVECGAYASVDVGSARACREVIEQCVGEFGGLDVLVNVAGRHQMRRTESMSDDDWAQDLAVNLNGPFFLCRAALPHLLERGGNIVNVSSIAGVEGQAYSAGYCAAKHGLLGLTRALAVEYTAERLRVNAVCPGGMLTPQIEQFTPRHDAAPRCRSGDRVPCQRCGGRGARRRLSRRQRQGRRLGPAGSGITLVSLRGWG
jgi:NAD(P)-dependent dehydrogenase (short-subunit alcohol dehydrogenase family)